jgi:hypothetical protein
MAKQCFQNFPLPSIPLPFSYSTRPSQWRTYIRNLTIEPIFHQMESQMLKQADAYFADLAQRNGPVRDIIVYGYTFLNERTSQWIYRRNDVGGLPEPPSFASLRR